MATPELEFHHLVSPQSVGEPPPRPSFHDAYALVYDENKKALLYLREHDSEYGNALALVSDQWKPFSKACFDADEGHPRSAFFDTSRNAIAVWAYEFHLDTSRYEARGMLLTNDTATQIETSGAGPKMEEDDEHSMIAGFDRRRQVTACLTPDGIWELDAKGVWSQVYKGEPIPKDWSHGTHAVAYDTKSERLVFFNGDRFLAWNGTKLEKLSAKTLPSPRFGQCDYAIASHPKHGLVAHVGASQLFALDGDRWSPLGVIPGSPPACGFAQMAYDPAQETLVLGPGKYESRGNAHQHVFFILQNGKWMQQGRIVKRVLPAGNDSSGWLKGEWFVSDGAELNVWRDGKWIQVLSKEAAQKQIPNEWPLPRTGQIVGDEMWVLTGNGRIIAWNGTSGRRVSKSPPNFNHRVCPEVCFDPVRSRYVVWGGILQPNRATNDTFIYDGKKWIVPKKASPPPKNLKDTKVELFFDTALGSVVRLAPEGAAVLIDEMWKPFPMSGGAKVGPAFHDARTQQTLILVDNVLWRFDLDRLQEVTTVTLPKCEQMLSCFDPEGRALHIQDHRSADGRWVVELGPAFDHAATLGPRTIPAELHAGKGADPSATTRAKKQPRTVEAFEPTRLYSIADEHRKFWFCDVEGTAVVRRWGRIGSAPQSKRDKKTGADAAIASAQTETAAKLREGYVEAKALTLAQLGILAGAQSRAFATSKTPKNAIGWAGGLPKGIAARRWPRGRDGRAVPFLMQVDIADVVSGFASVAVFVEGEDSEALENENLTHAVLLTAKDVTSGTTRAPEGVTAWPSVSLVAGAPKWELDENLVESLSELDPDLGAAFERLGKDLQTSGSKLGGRPKPVQDFPRGYPKRKLAFQIDFEGLSGLERVLEKFSSTGAMLYVMVSEKDGRAFCEWQYT